MGIKFDFLILEETGKIDYDTKYYANLLDGIEASVRFTRLFKNDEFKRSIRVLIENETFLTYDSVLDNIHFGQPKEVK